MIRFKNRVFEDYFIDPVTAVITDKDGNEQETIVHQGYALFKGMGVHRIQAHTALGYVKGMVVHHIDENPLNNSLCNLVYLTHKEHSILHNKGKKKSEQQKKKQHDAMIGRVPWNKGMKYSPEFAQKVRTCQSGPNNGFYGKHQPQSAKLKLKEEFTGSLFWNNGEKNVRAKECPGEGWIRGRLKR